MNVAPDDRVLAPTRWIARIIVPVLLCAFVILFGFPGRTRQLWAWTIQPEMTPSLMGAGYLAGSYYFVRVAVATEWHRVGAGLVAISVFATMLLGATLLHWDRFNHDHAAFWLWLALYVATPPLLPWLWVTNRRTDPGRRVPAGVVVPAGLRRAVGVGGGLTLLVALALFAFPSEVADAWPWALSPLTARTVAAFIAVPAVAWLWFLVEERWSALELLQQVVTIGFVLILVGSVRTRDGFRSGRFAPYVVGLGVSLALTVALQVLMRQRARPMGEPAAF